MAPSPLSTRFCGIVQAVVFAAVVLVFWPGGHDQFLLPKAMVLLIGVPVFAAAVLGKAAARRSTSGRWDRPLLILIGLFAAWSFVVPLWAAANRELHLIGALQRVLLCGLAVCAAAAVRGGTRCEQTTLGRLGIPAAVVALLALLQGTGTDPLAAMLRLQPRGSGRWRVLTTLGNPGWTAELLAVCLPIILGMVLARSAPGATRRLVAVAATIVVTAAIAVTGSRTGLLAAALGVAAGLAMASRESWRHGVARAFAIGLAVVLGGAVLAAWAGVSRWTDAAPVTGRAALWAAGGELTLDRPVTGWGLAHTRVELPRGLRIVVNRTPPSLRAWLPTTLVDRLDNDWLQAAVEGGVPSAVLLLGIWGRGVWNWGRGARRDGRPGAGYAAASLVALGACSLVSAPLHTPATAALFWILVGASARSGAAETRRDAGDAARRWSRVGLLLMGGLVAAGLGLAARLLPANEAAGRGRALLRAGRPTEAVALLERGASRLPWVGGIHPDLADAYNGAGRFADALAVTLRGEQWSASERLWAARAVALAELGHEAEARLVLRRASEVLPGSKVLSRTRSVLDGG